MKNLIFLFTALIYTCTAIAQFGIEWEKSYGGSSIDQIRSITATNDNGYILTGESRSIDFDVTGNNGFTDYWLVKIDSLGDIDWEKSYGGSSFEWVSKTIQTSDGGYMVVGRSNSDDVNVGGNYGLQDFWVVKLDNLGSIEWEKNYGGSLDELASSVLELPNNNGYIIGGTSVSSDIDVSSNNGLTDFWVIKIDTAGNILWEKNYGGSSSEQNGEVIATHDNGFLIAGSTLSFDGDVGANAGAKDYWIVKIDSLGNILWEQNYGGSQSEDLESVIQTSDNGFIMTGRSLSSDGDVNFALGGTDAWVVKVDSVGNIEWEKSYGGSLLDTGKEIVELSDKKYAFVGYSKSSDLLLNNYGGSDFFFVTIDSLGTMISMDNYGSSSTNEGLDLVALSDDEFILVGKSITADNDVSITYGNIDYWVVKIEKLSGSIQGKLIFDYNENCTYENSDSTVNGSIITATNAINGSTRFGYTNAAGEYYIGVDVGSHSIGWNTPSPYFDNVACSPNPQTLLLDSNNINDTLDFYMYPTVDCPYLTVDISTPLLRRCMSNTYVVSYCNQGSIAADSAFIIVDFDPNIIIDSTSIPGTIINPNSYKFYIGNLGIFECGSFSVSVTVECNNTFVGQILCSKAHIYPDTICLPDTLGWNGAELEASATCLGTDTVQFRLKNNGTGNMGSDVPIIAIEDVVLIYDDLIRLNSGDFQIWKFPINGRTQRIIVAQPANHPYLSYTTAAVSFCNTDDIVVPGPITDTSFLAYPNEEEAPYIAVDCQPIIGAYDPNDKSVSPQGVSSAHFITENMDLEYKIRFQNTGNDTAYTVVITDSISPLLDITTIQPGASSHPYMMDIYGNGVIKFTFDNILLVDSFTDEPNSHGFVQYKIEQKTSNQVGDVINNNADIFFDFNPAIRTNTVFNEIGGIILDTMIYKEPVGLREISIQEIKVYPNPAVDFMIFDLGEEVQTISLKLYDVTGKLMHQTISKNNNMVKLERHQLTAGTYFFKIALNEKDYASGTVIFQ